MSVELRVWAAVFWGLGVGTADHGPRMISFAVASILIAAALWARHRETHKTKARTTTLRPGEIYMIQAGDPQGWLSTDGGKTFHPL
jgi:hypothetical protein